MYSLRTVTLLRYKLGVVFFPFREPRKLVFDSGINTVHVQTVTCRYTQQQQLPGAGAHPAPLAQYRRAVAARAASPGSRRHRCDAVTRSGSAFKMLLDFTRERQTRLDRHTSYSSMDVRCNLQRVAVQIRLSVQRSYY